MLSSSCFEIGSAFVFRDELQETFHASARVFGSLPVVTVRQTNQAVVLQTPLGEGTNKELIDDDLSTVVEVTELSLPHGDALGMDERVASVVAHDSELRESRVGDTKERSVDRVNVLIQTFVDGFLEFFEEVVLRSSFSIVKDEVTLAEGATLDILTRETVRISFAQQGTDGECFSSWVINETVLKTVNASLEDGLHSWADLEAVRKSRERLGDFVVELRRDGGLGFHDSILAGARRVFFPVLGRICQEGFVIEG